MNDKQELMAHLNDIFNALNVEKNTHLLKIKISHIGIQVDAHWMKTKEGFPPAPEHKSWVIQDYVLSKTFISMTGLSEEEKVAEIEISIPRNHGFPVIHIHKFADDRLLKIDWAALAYKEN